MGIRADRDDRDCMTGGLVGINANSVERFGFTALTRLKYFEASVFTAQSIDQRAVEFWSGRVRGACSKLEYVGRA